MDLNMWDDTFLLGSEWGLDLPVDQPSNQFDDLKSGSHLFGDDLSLQPQDAVENFLSEASSKDNEDVLGMDWMESSDLSTFLDALGGSHEKLLPLEASLYEYSSSIAPEEFVENEAPVKEEPTHGLTLVKEEPTYGLHEITTSINECDVKQEIYVTEEKRPVPGATFDALVSPPSSPEQVAPVIQISTIPAASIDRSNKSFHHSLNVLDDSATNSSFNGHSFVFSELDIVSITDGTSVSTVSFDDASQLITSPLSADDVESMLSSSAPNSPGSSNQSSLIESSPELYKVISTSSIESPRRYSPYSKQKANKNDSKGAPRKSRMRAQPVPEHVIIEQVNKKDRKKLQNKNAAIRYRMKKKEEALGIKSEEQQLEEINMKLKTKVEDLHREIKYMKNLMEDVCRAKGLL